MSKPTLCMIHEGIGDFNAISKIAKMGIQIALDAGFKVSCVAQRLDEELAERVEWLPLYVPPKVFAYKWLTARKYMLRSIAGRTFDVIHAHQPQAAQFSDVFDCHFLTHYGHEQTLAAPGKGLRGWLERTQERIVLSAENRIYHGWNPHTHIFFDSRLTRKHFIGLYGEPPRSSVLPSVFPKINIATPEERAAAKASYFGQDNGLPVVGFLGGSTPRKGATRLMAAARREQDVKFLVGGSGSEHLLCPAAGTRFKPIGLVVDLPRFYAACDVLLVPSLYEPLGLVSFEAIARGTPVIATGEVGSLPYIQEYNAGAAWDPTESLAPVVRRVLAEPHDFSQIARTMEASLGREAFGRHLIETYEDVLRIKSVSRQSTVAVGV